MESEVNLSDQIFCMDCMELFPQIPDGYVSMILSDPRMEFPIRITLPI